MSHLYVTRSPILHAIYVFNLMYVSMYLWTISYGQRNWRAYLRHKYIRVCIQVLHIPSFFPARSATVVR